VRILAHRGAWTNPSEQNSIAAVARALSEGWGVETDIRPHDGRLWISHDPLGAPPWIDLAEILAIDAPDTATLALNVKGDGVVPILVSKYREALATWDWFLFDMSIPETVKVANAGMPFVRRMSEFEEAPDDLVGEGVWLDAFAARPFPTREVLSLISRGQRVAIVSPELHGRAAAPWWGAMKELPLESDLVLLCTDLPAEALSALGLAHA